LPLELKLGIKTDPIQYRYSYKWLFRLLKEEGLHDVQIGSFFEIYSLADSYFEGVRKLAEEEGIRIRSVFTSHRELGGFFREEKEFVDVARKSYERFIEISALLGAESAGSNPGAVLRDGMNFKKQGIRNYLDHMKELMHYAHEKGLKRLSIEPMSCLAEPPTLPEELESFGRDLMDYHNKHKDTVPVGYCVDVSHGYATNGRNSVYSNIELFKAALPYTFEVHLKNTDQNYESTFGFSEKERQKGILNVAEIRKILIENQNRLPVQEIVGYLEVGGPKLGRDYSDSELEDYLRASLRHLKKAFLSGDESGNGKHEPVAKTGAHPIQLSPSLMCADLTDLKQSVEELENSGADMIHFDVADGNFVPNLLLSADSIAQLRPLTSLPFDVHIMVHEPENFIDQFADIGIQSLSVHVESTKHIHKVLAEIQSRGIKAGAAINPGTPVEALECLTDVMDYVLLMTVNPGFAGQKLIPGAMDKIRECRKFLDDRGLSIPIEVDGNVSFKNIPGMIEAGAGILVGGTSSVYDKENSLPENVKKVRTLSQEAVTRRPRPALKV